MHRAFYRQAVRSLQELKRLCLDNRLKLGLPIVHLFATDSESFQTS